MNGAYEIKLDNPKKKANLLSKLFFTWAVPIFRIGTKRKIELSDLYKSLKEDKSSYLGSKLESYWENEIQQIKLKGNSNRKPSLLRVLIKMFFWHYFLVYGVITFINLMIIRSPQPVILAWFISNFDLNTNLTNDKQSLYLSASLLVTTSFITIFLMHHTTFGVSSVGMRVRIAVSSLIYRKILKLNKQSQNETAAGKVINILSNDVQRFDQVAPFLAYTWIMPFQLILVTYFMWNMIGVYCLIGVITMIIITIPLQTYLSKMASHLRLKVAIRCDNRVKHMSEIISGIHVIKMYAWEKPFEKLIKILREKEISALIRSSYLRGFFSSCNIFIERFTLFVTIIAYVLFENKISADIAFSLAQFFNILQLAMAILFPLAVSLAAESWVAIKRLEEILILDEKAKSTIQQLPAGNTLQISNINAEWIPGNSILENININVPNGKLCAVIGPVGAGKSSLLQLLLGELPFKTGTIQLSGRISYASQEPWLFAASVRKNILLGKPYDADLYKIVTEVCALKADFKQFAYGDRTMVGERGVSLSGGQRARINLARAIYTQADIYLLDDPLSAVDTHVGKHLFQECILDYLKDKTRILVTHQLQYLKQADHIIVLNEGNIEAQGTYEELLNRNLDFTKLLSINDDQHENEKNKVPHDDFDKILPSAEILRRRHSSMAKSTDSVKSVDEPHEAEEESGNDPNSKPLWNYFKSVENGWLVALVVFLFIIAMMACTANDYWVAYWTSQEEIRNQFNSSSNGIIQSDLFYDGIVTVNESFWILKTQISIYIYTFFILSVILLIIMRSLIFYKMAMEASKNIHKQMFHRILQAPMRFFDTNPSGRILNRFSKDMGGIDELLPRVLIDAASILLIMTGILINVTISNYYMVVAILILGTIFLKLRNWYISSAKDIKHLEGIAKSPVFSHISATLHGLTTIRASQAETLLIKEFDEHQDVHTSAWFLTIMCIVSFGLWLDIVCVIFTAVVTFGFVIGTEYGYVASGSLVGLALSQSLILTGMLQHGMRQSAEVVNQLTSVERVLQYTKLENEGPFETPKESRPKKSWPTTGNISFNSLSLSYIKDESPVLKNLNFQINSGEKIGIVGRTGAGKSSLISAIFRLAPIDGQILIDGVDTKTLGLVDLRKRISIIPQEPVLFSATLRYNLDPFDEFEDKKIWDVLEEVKLKDVANTLDYHVSEGGNNFSLGQRQLLCLARALLRNNRILILDEATANVDAKTDELIQATIRSKFQDCTVLTIAHRLNTIMDSDKVLVMGNGQLLEFGHPYELLGNANGYFVKMVEETGKSMAKQLTEISKESYQNKSILEYSD